MTISGNMMVNIEGGSPWGFRLQGGGNYPLQVLKVRKRSKSQRHLIEGDILIKVNGIPVQGKTHETVMDMVESTTGPLLNLEIYRGEHLIKIPKAAPAPSPTPLAAVAPVSQMSTKSTIQMSEQRTQHEQRTEESVFQKRIALQQQQQQQTSQQSSTVLQQQQYNQQQYSQQQVQQQYNQQQYSQQQVQQQQQQQVAKSSLVLKNQVQPQQKVTQIQQSSQWQESSSQQQQHQTVQQMSKKDQQNSLQHQMFLQEQQELARQQLAEQQSAREQLAQQRQMSLMQQQNSQTQQSSVYQEHMETSHVEQTTSVSKAMWTSGQATSLDDKQTDLVHHAYTSSPKPYKPKVASHLPLRDFTPVKPSPPPVSPVPTQALLDDKENLAPSPVPKAPSPVPNIPQFNVKNLKNLANQSWKENELEDLNLPIPDYSKKMTIPPRPPKEPSPPVIQKTITIPDMTIKPGPPVAPKPKRVLSEVQPQPVIADHEIIPIYTEDRPHLPVFGPPVVYGLNPALAPKRSTSMGEEESIVSETSSGSRRNDPNYEAKRQKIYSDSSFYYDPKGVYPTIEEQIDLCKKISQSLTAAANSRARGATMFAKRQKRSTKWIHDGFSEGNVADLADLADLYSELDASEGGTKPLFQFRIPKVAHQVSVDGPPKMSLSREEFESMRTTQPKVDHAAASPKNCMSILADLQNSKGRGAKLFAKRQARCDKWVIDDKSTSVSAPTTPSEPPAGMPSIPMHPGQNRLADMITKPMPIIQHSPRPAAPAPAPVVTPVVHKAPLPDPPVVKKNMGGPQPTANAALTAEFKSLLSDGPNFNRTAKGWRSVPFAPQSRPQRAQSVQPSSTKGPPPPVAPKPAKCMRSNPRATLWPGEDQLPVHSRSSSDQLRLLSPVDPYHDASGYCSDVDHRTKAYSFKKPGMYRQSSYTSTPRTYQPVHYSLPATDL